jgi:hypothetical protein
LGFIFSSFVFFSFSVPVLFVAVGPRYKLQGHIGSGTYGDVCKAIDLEFNQIIALKVQIILSCLLFELGIFRCKKKKEMSTWSCLVFGWGRRHLPAVACFLLKPKNSSI